MPNTLTEMQRFALGKLREHPDGLCGSYLGSLWAGHKGRLKNYASRDGFGFTAAAYKALRHLVAVGLANEVNEGGGATPILRYTLKNEINTSYFSRLEKETRDKCVVKYRELLIAAELGARIDWEAVDGLIIRRWSNAALSYIKGKAWVQRTEHTRPRTYVTAKNRRLEWDIFLVGTRDFGLVSRVGFSDRESASAHVDAIKAAGL